MVPHVDVLGAASDVDLNLNQNLIFVTRAPDLTVWVLSLGYHFSGSTADHILYFCSLYRPLSSSPPLAAPPPPCTSFYEQEANTGPPGVAGVQLCHRTYEEWSDVKCPHKVTAMFLSLMN